MASSISGRTGAGVIAERDKTATPYPSAGLRGTKMGSRRIQTLMLMNAPFYVILEVFSHLHPMDLLNLARACKEFRQFFMNKRKSQTLWRAARGNVEGLPECPERLSEPAYAALVFDPYCHNCEEPGSHRIVWEFFGRYCAKCIGPSCMKVAWTKPYAETYMAYTLRFVPDLELEQYLPNVVSHPEEDAHIKVYCALTGKELVKNYSSLQDDQEALDAYLLGLKERTALNKARAEAYYTWYPQFLERRLDDIIARLRREHWTGRILAMMSEEEELPLKNHPAVTFPRVLTDNEWNDRTRDVVVAALGEYEDKKIKQQRHLVTLHRLGVLRDAYSEHQGEQGLRTGARECGIGPHFADIALMPVFRALVESSFDADADIHDDRVNSKVFLTELAELPDLTANFNQRRELELSEKMAQAFGRPTWVGILDLAIAWFHCDVCNEYVRFPELLEHTCQRPWSFNLWQTPREEGGQDHYADDVTEVSDCYAWSSDTLSPIVPGELALLRSLVAACELDPETATAAQMDALDARVTPVRPDAVDDWFEGEIILTWREAALLLPEIRMRGTVQWEQVPEYSVRSFEGRALVEGRYVKEFVTGLSRAFRKSF